MANRIPPAFRRNALLFRFEILVAIVIPLTLGAALALLGRGRGTLLAALYKWLTISAGTDSWMPLNRAVEQFNAGKAIYASLFFQEHTKFQYPPSSVVIFAYLKDLGIAEPAGLNLLNWWLVAGNAMLVAFLGIAMARNSAKPAIREHSLLLGLLSLLACLLSYPVMRAYALGQAQVWINFLFAGACLCWYYGKKSIAGAAIGLICLIKPQFGLFLIWALVARQWQFILGWVAIFAPVTSISLAMFGIGEHIDYLQVLSALSRSGESYFANQSLNGLLNRLLDNGPVLDWDGNAYPPVLPFVRWSTLLFSILLVGAVLLRQVKRHADLADFQLAALAFTMASPIAWEHHYGILPAIFVTSYFMLQAQEGSRVVRRTGILLALAFVLSEVSLGKWSGIAAAPWNLLYSYNFLGAALLAWILYSSGSPSVRRPAPIPVTGAVELFHE
jgi:alpha-1,2-mannosyltransferase